MSKGTIFTFYSYKGGVGRTFALANIGALLSLWGYKTLCIDWDLEAPGLHSYFRAQMKPKNYRGLTELIQDYADGKNPLWRDYVTEVNFSNAKQPLLLMSAGYQDASYIQRIQAFDWTKLYEEHDLGKFLEELRWNWKEALDFVLIDSRTGITDIGGICTVSLPDILVLLFTANDQSLYGSLKIVEHARLARANLPFDRAKLLVLPIAGKFEGRVEYKLAQDWLATFAKELEPLYREWAHREVTTSDLLNFTRIPYIPYWSFGEKLPVIEKGTDDPDDIGFPLETLAALVGQQLSYCDVLIRNRDLFVATAKKGPVRDVVSEQAKPMEMPHQPVRIFLSYSYRDKPLVEELETHLSSLEHQGLIQIFSDRSIQAGSNWRNEIDLRLDEADIVLLLISPDYIASDYVYSSEMKRVLERHFDGQTAVIPVILRASDWTELPFGNLQVLPSNGRPITSWTNRDQAFLNVTREIRKLIQTRKK